MGIKIGSEPHLIPGLSHKFDVEIEKTKGVAANGPPLMGLKLDTQDGETAYITEIEDGVCKDHNRNVNKHEEGHHIRKGDFIVGVQKLGEEVPKPEVDKKKKEEKHSHKKKKKKKKNPPQKKKKKKKKK